MGFDSSKIYLAFAYVNVSLVSCGALFLMTKKEIACLSTLYHIDIIIAIQSTISRAS